MKMEDQFHTIRKNKFINKTKVMTNENLAAIWLITGVIYAVINGLVRKIDTDGDWLLPIVWITLWPITIPALIVSKLYNLIFKTAN